MLQSFAVECCAAGRAAELVLSKLDEPTLQQVALTTGGRYVRSVTGDVDLEQIYLQGIKASTTDQELETTRSSTASPRNSRRSFAPAGSPCS